MFGYLICVSRSLCPVRVWAIRVTFETAPFVTVMPRACVGDTADPNRTLNPNGRVKRRITRMAAKSRELDNLPIRQFMFCACGRIFGGNHRQTFQRFTHVCTYWHSLTVERSTVILTNTAYLTDAENSAAVN